MLVTTIERTRRRIIRQSVPSGDGVTQYITDDRGRTCILSASTISGRIILPRPNLSNDPLWPIDTSGKVRSIPSILDKSKFDTLTVFGKVQLVYKGWPLYHFGQDSLRAQQQGDQLSSSGICLM